MPSLLESAQSQYFFNSHGDDIEKRQKCHY
jgi:hypothetical protein